MEVHIRNIQHECTPVRQRISLHGYFKSCRLRAYCVKDAKGVLVTNGLGQPISQVHGVEASHDGDDGHTDHRRSSLQKGAISFSKLMSPMKGIGLSL